MGRRRSWRRGFDRRSTRACGSNWRRFCARCSAGSARDHARLHGYHDDLRRESFKRLAALEGVEGTKADADRQRENQRIQAIEREYRANSAIFRHNYALRVTVDWIQTLELYVPVQRLEVLIRRRKGERVIQLDWHPLVRLAEPPLCDWGPGFNATRMICDERLHLTEPAGQDPCPGCGKPFCRACHPAACPRCDMAVSDEHMNMPDPERPA